MQHMQQVLLDEIAKLPIEKVGKVLSYLRYVEQEQEIELYIDPAEEEELDALCASGDFIDASELEAIIKAMPDD